MRVLEKSSTFSFSFFSESALLMMTG